MAFYHRCMSFFNKNPIFNHHQLQPDIEKFAFFRWYLPDHAPQIHSNNYLQSDLSNTLKNNHAGMNKISPTSVDCERGELMPQVKEFVKCGEELET